MQQLESPAQFADNPHDLEASQHQHDNPAPIPQHIPGIPQENLVECLQGAHRLVLTRHDTPREVGNDRIDGAVCVHVPPKRSGIATDESNGVAASMSLGHRVGTCPVRGPPRDVHAQAISKISVVHFQCFQQEGSRSAKGIQNRVSFLHIGQPDHRIGQVGLDGHGVSISGKVPSLGKIVDVQLDSQHHLFTNHVGTNVQIVVGHLGFPFVAISINFRNRPSNLVFDLRRLPGVGTTHAFGGDPEGHFSNVFLVCR
mmetsp:Transcript_7335/g.17940  ORF Transcript_7335/g.17940 Transcript_7335/m.17940 type:complete len:256 (-) Transcript_7335:503-1270(-)